MSRPRYELLVAEPDRLQLQLIDMLLAAGEYDLTLAETGKEALEHLKSQTPDLCVLALDLPDVAGDVICGKLRRVTRLARTPVILVSRNAGKFGLSDDARARARKAGADLVLPRPLGDKNLRERVQFLLDARDQTPTREGYTTEVIEEALGELLEEDAVMTDGEPGPERVPPPAPVSPADPDPTQAAQDAGAPTPPSPPPEPPRPEASRPEPSRPEPSPRGMAYTRRGREAGDAEMHYGALKQELDSLRMENAQLKRKLAEKNAALEQGVNPKMQKRIDELERRNQALLDTIEELKRDHDGGRGGFFGRRS